MFTGGAAFESFSSIEFECSVEWKKSEEIDQKDEDAPGRKKRRGIDLDENHPLTKHRFKGFIKTKFCNPIFGGSSIPSCPKDDFNLLGKTSEEKEKSNQMEKLSEWLISAFTPWTIGNDGYLISLFEFSNKGLLDLMKSWDNSNASEINKQRFRSIQKILQRKKYSNKHRDALTCWRYRNTDWWHETEKVGKNSAFGKSDELDQS